MSPETTPLAAAISPDSTINPWCVMFVRRRPRLCVEDGTFYLAGHPPKYPENCLRGWVLANEQLIEVRSRPPERTVIGGCVGAEFCMPKPPLRAGIEPLIQIGAIKEPLSLPDDLFLQFLIFCEMTYRENLALKRELKRREVDPVGFVARQAFPPGSSGPHRKVFDLWYVHIAEALKARLSKREGRKSV